MSDPKAKSKRSTPKGMYVNLPEELRKEVDERCKESYRSPGAEIAWIVREYLNKVDDAMGGTEVRPSAVSA